MRRHGWFIPYCIGAIVVTGINLALEHRKLEQCKAETGAYECKMVATPQQQPAWVQNGESE